MDRIQAFYPTGFLRELKAICILAWPTSLATLFHYIIQPISLSFCGHLGKDELASASMAIAVIYMVCVSVGRGLAFGGDTFFSQVYGSANKKMMGVYLQKCFIYGVFCAALMCGVLLNTEKLLLLIGQDPAVARLTHEYTMAFLPGCLAYTWLFILMRYLLCQSSVIPNLIMCVIGAGVCAALHYGLVYEADMGIKGSAIAVAATYYIVLLLLVAYIWLSGLYRKTWAGWSWDCLEDWGSFTPVVLSSILMTLFMWFYQESGTFLGGLIGSREISANTIGFLIDSFAWMVPMGIGGAATARVGQCLGANQPLAAITACRVSMTISGILLVLIGIGCYIFRWYISALFTSDLDMIDFTANIMKLVALYVSMEGICGLGISISRGTGRQKTGAIVLFVSNFVIALPVGVPLMFATNLGLPGLWWGYNLGLAIQCVWFLVFIARLDWQAEADKAQMRAGLKWKLQSESMLHSEDAEGRRTSRSKIVLKRLVVVVCVLLLVGALISAWLLVPYSTFSAFQPSLPTHSNQSLSSSAPCHRS